MATGAAKCCGAGAGAGIGAATAGVRRGVGGCDCCFDSAELATGARRNGSGVSAAGDAAAEATTAECDTESPGATDADEDATEAEENDGSSCGCCGERADADSGVARAAEGWSRRCGDARCSACAAMAMAAAVALACACAASCSRSLSSAATNAVRSCAHSFDRSSFSSWMRDSASVSS